MSFIAPKPPKLPPLAPVETADPKIAATAESDKLANDLAKKRSRQSTILSGTNAAANDLNASVGYNTVLGGTK